jgi:hypothetical protein
MRPPVEDPALCRAWFEQLWLDVCRLRERYSLPVRTRWWESPLQVEALAAIAAWVERYDSGEWDDPPGKLALLYDLERVAAMLRDGNDPFSPDRDRRSFDRFLVAIGETELRSRDATTDTKGFEED